MIDLASQAEKDIQQRRRDTPTPQAAFHLPHKGLAFVYQRQSSHEQRRKNVWSQHAQDGLAQKAAEDGYPEELIVVEKRDLGITGRKTERGRPGFAHLVSLVEQGKVESIWVRACDRLYRDMDYENAAKMANTFRKHAIVICTPCRRYNLKLRPDYDGFHDEMTKAVQENWSRTMLLCDSRFEKAKLGFWCGSPVPAGFIVAKRQGETETAYGVLVAYLPHAEIIPLVFQAYVEHRGSDLLASQSLRRQRIVLPFFPEELSHMKSRSSLRRTPKTELGYVITPNLIKSIVSNSFYAGWWHYGGELIDKKHHPPLVADDLFWNAYGLARSKKPRGNAIRFEPLAFYGLFRCLNHDEPPAVRSLNAEGRYVCDYHYKTGVAAKCLSIARSQLEGPLLAVILKQLDLGRYTGMVLDQLQKDQRLQQFKETQRQRDREAVQRRIRNLQAGLDEADTKEKRDIIWQQFTENKAKLAEFENVPIPEVKVSDLDVARTREFLSTIGVNWPNISQTLQNRLIKLIIERVDLKHDGHTVNATIVWKTGFEQQLVIHRPVIGYCSKTIWSDEEVDLLRALWPSASKTCVVSSFPQRTWESLSCKARSLGLKRKHMLGDETERPRRSRKPRWEVKSNTVILNQKECFGRSPVLYR